MEAAEGGADNRRRSGINKPLHQHSSGLSGGDGGWEVSRKTKPRLLPTTTGSLLLVCFNCLGGCAEANNKQRHVLALIRSEHSACRSRKQSIFLECHQAAGAGKKSLSNILLLCSCILLRQLVIFHYNCYFKMPFPNMAEAVYQSEGFIEHIVQQCYENVDLRVGATAFTARQSVRKTTNILMQRSHVQKHTATICLA